jgi:hypothetical protein
VDLNRVRTTARRNGQPEGCPTKTHRNRRTPATKKHAVRVLGRYGINGVRIPALDFAISIEIVDQDWAGVNDMFDMIKIIILVKVSVDLSFNQFALKLHHLI